MTETMKQAFLNGSGGWAANDYSSLFWFLVLGILFLWAGWIFIALLGLFRIKQIDQRELAMNVLLTSVVIVLMLAFFGVH